MNHPTDIHEPTAEFRSHLEWQIETAMRRESRLAEPVSGSTPSRWFPTLVIVLLALVAGGAAGIASERVQDAKTRDQLVENIKSERALVQTRLELAKAELQDTQRRFEVGAAGREILADAQRRVMAAESALARLEVDAREIQQTSSAPRNELNAPLAGGKDFVRDRLRLELAAAERDLVAAEETANHARARFETGTGNQAELLRADTDRAMARNRLQQLRMRLELREKFVNDQVTAEQLAQQVRHASLFLEADLVRQQLASAKARLDSLRAMVEIGTMSPLDAKRAEVELLELEIKLKRIQQQLGAVKKEE